MIKLKILTLILCVVALSACGVKSDPTPPETPAEIGKGKPLYKGGDIDNDVPSIKSKKDDKNENEE